MTCLKLLALSVYLFFGHTNMFAQVDLPIVEVNTATCGMTFPFGSPLIGNEYIFEDEIEKVTIDTLSNTAYVCLKTKKKTQGKLALFDFSTEKIR